MTSGQPKMIDVAKLAGVSIKTVSRVLNNEPHVQETVRERVRSAVSELGYVPSNSARSLRGSRSYTISMICRSERSNYVNAIQFGAVVACQTRGYQLTISLVEPLDDMVIDEVRTTIGQLIKYPKPDGVLLVAPLANNPLVSQVFAELEMPVARVGPTLDNDEGCRVAINEREAAHEMTRHLLKLKHTRIGFVRGKENQAATQERFDGYKAALIENGIKFDWALVQKGQFDFQSGVRAAKKLLALAPPVTAIFASNDEMAAGVMMAANRQDVKVPEDLSVVGFDDSEIAENVWPMLTTVRQPLHKLGEVAASKLIESVGKPDLSGSATTILSHEIVMRQSSTKLKRTRKS